MNDTFLTLVPSLTRKKKHGKDRKSGSVKKEVVVNLNASIKLAYLNKRPISADATLPSTKVTFIPSSTGTNIGPGKYKTFSYAPTPSFEFSRCERFKNEDNYSKLFLFKTTTDEQRQGIMERIQKNNKIAIQPKNERAKSVSMNACREKFRGEVTRITKKAIFSGVKAKRAAKIQEKFLKYEFRMRSAVTFI